MSFSSSSPTTQNIAASNNNDRVRNQLKTLLARSGLPRKLIERLLLDIDGGHHYQRVASIEELQTVPPNSSYAGVTLANCCCCNCTEGVLIEKGKLGKLRVDDSFYFLAPGYHTYSTLGSDYVGECATAVFNTAVTHGPSGFITVTEGFIGVLLVGAEYKLLAPGSYCWNSNSVRYVETVDVTKTIAKLGVFTLVTVPEGLVAVSYLNGELKILGQRGPSIDDQGSAAALKCLPEEQLPQQRTYFLDDPKWIFSSFLSTKTQTDRLEGLDVLSADNVEMILAALGEWKICDPFLAINECADDMETIRAKVDALLRATISRIVASTAIGHNVSGASASDVHRAHNEEDADLAHLMKSSAAIKHMTDLSRTLSKMGVEVFSVYVPEKRMKNDDIRREVARQAVIQVKAAAEESAANAQAYATTTASRAQAASIRELATADAFAITTKAKAEAEAVRALAEAHADAGKRLGAPNETAARLALSEVVGKSFKDAKITLFSGTPDKMPFMFSNEMK